MLEMSGILPMDTKIYEEKSAEKKHNKITQAKRRQFPRHLEYRNFVHLSDIPLGVKKT